MEYLWISILSVIVGSTVGWVSTINGRKKAKKEIAKFEKQAKKEIAKFEKQAQELIMGCKLEHQDKKIMIFTGKMGSGISFYISQLFNKKNTRVYKRLYSNDENRLKEIEALVNYKGENELYLIIEIPFENDDLLPLVEKLIQNEKIYIVLDIYENKPFHKFTELTENNVVYKIKDYILLEANSEKFLNLEYSENELYKEIVS